MENYKLSISSAIGTGWEYAKKHGLMIAVILLIVYVATNALSGLFGTNIEMSEAQRIGERMGRGDMEALKDFANLYSSTGSTIASLITALVEIVLYVGLYNLALGLIRGTYTTVTFDAFKLPLMTYVKYLVVEILVGIISGVATLLCIIPAFFVVPRIVLAPIYIIENPEAGVFEAITASWNMTKGNTLAMIGLWFAFVGILIVGFLCCCIGAVFAEVIILFATVAAYYQLRGDRV